MTKRERTQLRQSIDFLMADPMDWDAALLILSELAGVTIPSLHIEAQAITIADLGRLERGDAG